MAYLFSVALGPAQEFIAAARRTRDPWLSSWLLSELSKAAARAIGAGNLIVPAVDSDGDLHPGSRLTVANKILAKVDAEPPQLSACVRQAVKTRLQEIREEAFRQLPDAAYDRSRAIAQIDDLPEIYCAAVPLIEGEYKASRRQVEALLAARKNTRNFRPTREWAGNEYKSSLDGLRESVIRSAAALEKLGVKKAETLCGVGLLKRLGKRDARFWSTSHVAALPLILSLNQAHVEAINRYKETLDALGANEPAFYRHQDPVSPFFPYDGHVLFEEQLKEFFADDQTDELRKAKVALRQLLKEVVGGQSPSPYYAILHGDGDRMGEVIDAQNSETDHRRLSAALSAFAGQVQEAVRAHRGSLIYAGGDDVLALLPLHTAVRCARALADEFRRKLSEFKSEEGLSPTLSAGIAIAHQMEPLEDALNLARAAEKEAKQLDGKNALCLKVSKRSGAVITVKDHWGGLDERLLALTGFHQREEVPDGAAYELRQLAADFRDFAPEHQAAAYRKEAARILSRKRAGRRAEEIKRDVQDTLLNRLAADPQTAEDAMRSLADELIAARLFVNRFAPQGETA